MTGEEAKKIIFNQWQSFLEHNIDYGGISEAYKMAMKALEQPKWIPVTERLPEEEGWYLVTDASGGIRMTEHSFYMPQEDKMEEPYWDYMNVIAWMPLPEPYKAESEVEE